MPQAQSRKRSSSDSSSDEDVKHAFPKRPKIEERTDPTRWRMRDDESRHTWHYMRSDEAAKNWPQTLADKYYMNLPLVLYAPSETTRRAQRQGSIDADDL